MLPRQVDVLVEKVIGKHPADSPLPVTLSIAVDIHPVATIFNKVLVDAVAQVLFAVIGCVRILAYK